MKFRILLLLAVSLLSVSQMWGQTATITITNSSIGGKDVLDSGAYNGGAERVWTQDGVDFGGKAITCNNTNMPTNPTAQCTYIQAQPSSGVIYNTTAFPGRIVSVQFTGTASVASTLYVGSTGRLVNNATGNYDVNQNSPTTIGASGNVSTYTWTMGVATNYTYFAIKRGSSAQYFSSIVITYETIPGAPTLGTSSTSLSGFSYIEGNGPSSNQSFILSGSNLDGSNVELIAIDDNFEISTTTNDVDFGDSITLSNYNGGNTTIYVRLKAGLSIGNYTDTILIAGGGVATEDEVEISLSGEVVEPITVLTSDLSQFTYAQGQGPSAHQTFTVSGSNLADNITITVPNDYEIHTNQTFPAPLTGNTYQSITLNKNASNNVNNTPIHIRLKLGLTQGSYIDLAGLLVSSLNATTKTADLDGLVTAPVSFINVRAVVGSDPSISGNGDGSNVPSYVQNTLFAAQLIGNSETKDFFIENQGGSTLTINSIDVEGLNTGDFSVVDLLMNSNPVTLPIGIPAEGSLYFSITFAPTEIGQRDAIISINNDSSNVSPTYLFNIRGTGNNAEINITGNGIDIPSGNTAISSDDFTYIGNANLNPSNPATASKTFVIENTGNAVLEVSNITITGADASDFSVSPTSMNINGGNTATFTVTFDPDTTGTKNAVINIANNDVTGNENPYTFAIRGGTINYIACVLGEQVIYETGFEGSEFAAGTNYQGSVYNGPTGQQWFTYYGTPSTTEAISGSQSMQMRWYTSAPSNLGYTFTDFDLPNVTKITFRAKNLNAINCIVSYSIDGGATYVNPQTYNLTTSATSYEYIVSATGEYENVRLKFEMTFSSAPTNTSRLYIDDVVVYTALENEKIWDGTAWSGDGNPPTSSQKAVFEGDYSGVSVEACECEIRNNANVTVTENNSFIIQSDITLTSGTLTVENNANLIQINDFAVNTGAINVERITRPMNKFSFTYWGSPVQTNSNAIQWHSESSPNVFDNIETVTTRYAWNPADNLNGGQMGWYAHSGATTAGDGYIIQAPSNFPEIQAERKPIKATFTGGPYNGNINRTVVPNGGTSNSPYENSKMTFLSNPYPSAIDIDKFLFEYGGFPVSDEDFVIPTIYLWTHATTPEVSQNGGYNYASSDFATYSLLGGVTASPISPLPDGKIASGQGFFIMGSTTGGDVTFKNSYRYDENGGYDNNVFFKQMDSQSNSFEAHRFWLNFTGENATFKQTLIGYSNLANDGIDGLDGLYYDGGNPTNLYTILDELPFSIQAFALPFSDNDVIPLGYKVAETGTYTITLDDFDGLFDNQDIYIKDNLLETTHNLKDGVYEFLTNSGTFENRFEVVFKPNGDLNIQNPTNLENNWIVYVKNGQFHLEALGFEIKEIYVYDMLGREVYAKQDVNANQHSFNKINGNQILIVKIVSAENVSSVKKIGN